MEILALVLLYHLAQNPDFAESVKPLMEKIKNSEQILRFLNDLSKFPQPFGSTQNEPCQQKDAPQKPPKPPKESPCDDNKEKEKPQSPTKGIADEFIQNLLDSYLQNQIK